MRTTRGSSLLQLPLIWVAVEDLKLTYHIPKDMLFTPCIPLRVLLIGSLNGYSSLAASARGSRDSNPEVQTVGSVGSGQRQPMGGLFRDPIFRVSGFAAHLDIQLTWTSS